LGGVGAVCVACWFREPFAHIPPPESSLDEARLELFVTLLSQPHINLGTNAERDYCASMS